VEQVFDQAWIFLTRYGVVTYRVKALLKLSKPEPILMGGGIGLPEG